MEVSISYFLPPGIFYFVPVINNADCPITKFVLHNCGYKKDIFFIYPAAVSIRTSITKFSHKLLAILAVNKTLSCINNLFSRLQFTSNMFKIKGKEKMDNLCTIDDQSKNRIKLSLFFQTDICQSEMK